MSKRDYYEILGVERTATDGQMKTAFRKLAMTYHPDRNPGDKEAEIKFKELNEAYQCLSDGQKRAAYDRFGHAAFSQGGAGGPGFGNEFGDFMSDIFDNFFGDGRGGGQARGRGGAP
ncbi:DnaJ domain-containing protein, partial [Methylobacterium hispanicum]